MELLRKLAPLDVDILIANDYYAVQITGDFIKMSQRGLVAMNTKIGWLLSGPTTFLGTKLL